MQSSPSADHIYRPYPQLVRKVEPYCFSSFQVLENSMCFENQNKLTQLSFESRNDEQFFTLESASCTDLDLCDEPQAQCSRSNLSDPHHSFSDAYGSPSIASSVMKDAEVGLVLGDFEKNSNPKLKINDFSICSMISNQNIDTIPKSDLKQVLLACAEAVSDEDFQTAWSLINALEHMVSITGEPIERLGAYMLEGLRARLLSSGSMIYRKLKCKEATGSELMSYMQVLAQICPYYKFACCSANLAILETMEKENNIHIIDFQIAQGSQWASLIERLAKRPGGPPSVRITGVDDSNSTHARGGGLDLVARRLSDFAKSCGVPFEFNGAAIDGCDVKLENLRVRHGEALAVNFPYVLHHMPDESVSTENHRDRLLRLVKSLSPKIVTLVEQESNTNTAPFLPRFRETLDYYMAMFESIDAAWPRDDGLRIGAEEHCVARDIVNIIACEGAERVERHEPYGKWRSRLVMAGLSPCPLSFSVCNGVGEVLKEYSDNFGLDYNNGVLHLCWKNRHMSTSSAWR